MRHQWPSAALVLAALLGAGCSDGPDGAGTTTTGARDQATRFAECMRDNGVREFPDPDAAGELTIDAIANGTPVDVDGAAWRTAIRACRDLQPPGFTGRERSDEQQEGALAFAECIRANGVRDFPDPAVGQPLVDTNRIPSAATEGGMAILNAAMAECRAAAADAGVGKP